MQIPYIALITLAFIQIGLSVIHFHYGYSCFAGCESTTVKTSTGTIVTLFIKDN